MSEWIEHDGGECPIDKNVFISWRLPKPEGTLGGPERAYWAPWNELTEYKIATLADIKPIPTGNDLHIGQIMKLPTDPQERKEIPITTGVLDYFPLAIAEVAKCSKKGNDQHHPDQPLHWARDKSTDHADCIARHLIDRGTFDTDGIRHSAKLAWRALALLQTELENDK